MYNFDEEIDLEFIRDGDPIDAMYAADQICEYEFPLSNKLIADLIEIAGDKNSRHWSRVAAIMILGQMDRTARSVETIDRVLKDNTEDERLRECANTAIFLFYRHFDEAEAEQLGIQACSE